MSFVVSLQRILQRSWRYYGRSWCDAFDAEGERLAWLSACFDAWWVGVQDKLLRDTPFASENGNDRGGDMSDDDIRTRVVDFDATLGYPGEGPSAVLPGSILDEQPLRALQLLPGGHTLCCHCLALPPSLLSLPGGHERASRWGLYGLAQ